MEQKQGIKTARLAGVWYLLLALSGLIGFLIFHPQIFVSDNSEQTLTNLVNQAFVARFRFILELLIVVSQALAAFWFYKLFSHVNKSNVLILAIWGTVNAMVIMVSAIAMSSAIEIAGSALPFQEKIPLIQLLSSLITNAWLVGSLFFGLWLIPMGYLTLESNRIPLSLGRILIIGGFGYLLQAFILSAGVKSLYVDILVLPATIGEFWMIGYLLVYGIKPVSGNSNE